MNEDLIKQHGLTIDEFKIIHKYLKRDLSIEELEFFLQCGMNTVVTRHQKNG